MAVRMNLNAQSNFEDGSTSNNITTGNIQNQASKSIQIPLNLTENQNGNLFQRVSLNEFKIGQNKNNIDNFREKMRSHLKAPESHKKIQNFSKKVNDALLESNFIEILQND